MNFRPQSEACTLTCFIWQRGASESILEAFADICKSFSDLRVLGKGKKLDIIKIPVKNEIK